MLEHDLEVVRLWNKIFEEVCFMVELIETVAPKYEPEPTLDRVAVH